MHVGNLTVLDKPRKLTNLVLYGFILVFVLQAFLATSLAEFVSAYPVEGGMYHWIAAIAPKRYNSVLSFATGWSTVFGCKVPVVFRHLYRKLTCSRDIYNCIDELDICNELYGSHSIVQNRPRHTTMDDLRRVSRVECLHIQHCYVRESIHSVDK